MKIEIPAHCRRHGLSEPALLLWLALAQPEIGSSAGAPTFKIIRWDGVDGKRLEQLTGHRKKKLECALDELDENYLLNSAAQFVSNECVLHIAFVLHPYPDCKNQFFDETEWKIELKKLGWIEAKGGMVAP